METYDKPAKCVHCGHIDTCNKGNLFTWYVKDIYLGLFTNRDSYLVKQILRHLRNYERERQKMKKEKRNRIDNE